MGWAITSVTAVAAGPRWLVGTPLFHDRHELWWSWRPRTLVMMGHGVRSGFAGVVLGVFVLGGGVFRG